MNIINRYIVSQLLTSTAVVLLVLLGLYTFLDFMTELDDLGKGAYQLADMASYMALTMPKRIYELLPIAALLGSMMGLGTLAGQSELVAMRAAGVSITGINRAVLYVAVFLMLIAVLVGEAVRPVSEQKARELQSLAQTGTVGSRSEFGFWTRDGDHFNHIERINPDGSFSNVVIYEFDTQNRLRLITQAESAKFEAQSWLLTDVVQSQIDEAGIEVRSVRHAKWSSKLNPGMVNIVIVPPEFLPLWDLIDYIRYLKDNFQSSASYELAFWVKMMMPLSTLVMVLLAVPFIFGPLRSATVGGRILVGVVIGITFHLVNQTFQQMGLVYGLIPWVAACLPTVIFATVAIYMNRQVK